VFTAANMVVVAAELVPIVSSYLTVVWRCGLTLSNAR